VSNGTPFTVPLTVLPAPAGAPAAPLGELGVSLPPQPAMKIANTPRKTARFGLNCSPVIPGSVSGDVRHGPGFDESWPPLAGRGH
jgi:hypothetical protein